MDKSTVESNAVNHVSLALSSTKIIKPALKEGDKTLSWDGELFVYNSEDFNKTNLITTIPAQVKGRTLKKYANTHPVEVADLINFKKKNNILYFVVQYVGNEYKIFYIALHLYDLEKLLKGIGKRLTKSLQLSELPINKPDKIKSIVLSFIKNAQRQSQLIPGVLNTEELQKKIEKPILTFNIDLRSNFNCSDIYNSIVSQRPYLYYKDDKGAEFPVDRFENVENLVFGHHKQMSICVDGVKYFDGYDVIHDNHGEKIQIARYINIIFNGKKTTLNYKFAGKLKDRTKILTFLLAIHEGKTLSFGDVDFPIQEIKLKEQELERIQTLENFYRDILTFFERLGIKKELEIDKLNEQQINNLYDFCQSELYNKEVALGLGKTGLGAIRLNNINIYAFCLKTSNANKVYNIFNDKYVGYCLIIGEEKIKVSPYLLLAEKENETFDLIDNINYLDLIVSIKKYGIPDKTEEVHIQLLLKMLLHYDKTKAPDTLTACIELAKILYEYHATNVNFINLAQAIKRRETLSSDIIQQLIHLKGDDSTTAIKLACSILLESKLETEQYLNELEENQRIEFSKFPIMNLYMT